MMYSTGMPVLYLSTCVQLLFYYWMDKICGNFFLKLNIFYKDNLFLVLMFYRKLKNIDEKLETYSRDMMIFGAIIHIIFGVWILGNNQIFNNVSS